MSGEKMIPKKVLLAALHEILDIARHPEQYAAKATGTTVGLSESLAFALGFIEGTAREALRAEPPTAGWLVAGASPSEQGTGAANADAAVVRA